MGSYLAAVGVILTLIGTAFWRLVWNFLFDAPHEKYSTKIGEARDVIYERKFLPIIASICDSVVIRKDILRTAETVELLNEFSISTRLRGELVSVVSERIALVTCPPKTVPV